MKFVTIDKSKLPIISVQFEAMEPTPEEFEEFILNVEQIYKEHTGIVMIYHGKNLKFIPSKLRIRLGSWLKENKKLIKGSVIGSAYIIPTTIGRMMMSGVFLIQSPEWKTKIVKTEEEAIEWTNSLL